MLGPRIAKAVLKIIKQNCETYGKPMNKLLYLSWIDFWQKYQGHFNEKEYPFQGILLGPISTYIPSGVSVMNAVPFFPFFSFSPSSSTSISTSISLLPFSFSSSFSSNLANYVFNLFRYWLVNNIINQMLFYHVYI